MNYGRHQTVRGMIKCFFSFKNRHNKFRKLRECTLRHVLLFSNMQTRKHWGC